VLLAWSSRACTPEFDTKRPFWVFSDR
jgi:hypothetical protein